MHSSCSLIKKSLSATIMKWNFQTIYNSLCDLSAMHCSPMAVRLIYCTETAKDFRLQVKGSIPPMQSIHSATMVSPIMFIQYQTDFITSFYNIETNVNQWSRVETVRIFYYFYWYFKISLITEGFAQYFCLILIKTNRQIRSKTEKHKFKLCGMLEISHWEESPELRKK